MAVIEKLQEKVQKAGERVQKCEGTIARHEKILANKQAKLIKEGIDASDLTKIEELKDLHRGTEKVWGLYEITTKQDDIKGATKKLAEAVQTLSNWQEKLDLEIEKERFLEGNAPQVIKDFLEEWKVKATEWHIQKYDKFLVFRKDLYEKEKEAYKECEHLRYDGRRAFMAEKGLDNIDKRLMNFAGQTVVQMATIRTEENRLIWLDKVLEEDKKAKMLDLINRINGIVGTITDASYLSVSQEGNLNGYIIGEKDSATVNTIGAGGYAVQCFHYRTLINKLKK